MNQAIDRFFSTETAFADHSDRELRRIYDLFRLLGNNTLSQLGAGLTQWAIRWHLPIKPFVKPLVYDRFCGGETLEKCVPVIARLELQNVMINLNYGVELKESDDDFDATLQENLRAIAFAEQYDTVRIISCKVSGLGPFELLEKKQNGTLLSEEDEAAWDRMVHRLDAICLEAARRGIKIYWDAEETWVQDAIDDLVDELMMRYNRTGVTVYNSFQMYRHDRMAFLMESLDRARTNDYLLGAKLVRGAYMEKEREHARKQGLPSPIHETKALVDRDFDDAVRFCIDHIDHVSVCVASHNEYSNYLAAQHADDRSLPRDHPHLWFSQLYGMGEHLTLNLAKKGYNAAEYVPYGPVREVIPYLIRRAQENSSVDGQMSRELQVLRSEMERRGM